MGSKRLPGKVKMDIDGHPMIWHVERRVKAAVQSVWGNYPVAAVVIGWPNDDEDENDVLGRYARIATDLAVGAIVRVTGDCPLIAPEAISDVLRLFQTLYRAHEYVANDIIQTYPDGLGVEVFTRSALERAHCGAVQAYDREHVTPYMKRSKLNNPLNIPCPINGISDLKLSVDTQADLDFVRAIYAAGLRDFSLMATLEAVERVKRRNAIGHMVSEAQKLGLP